MILIINICKEKLHELEFVRPIVDIVKNRKESLIVHYENLTSQEIKKADKVIICGTSLKDFEYSNNFKKFEWIKNFGKPVLGICGGMHLIGLVFGGKLKQKKRIGFYKENFYERFLGLSSIQGVYHLHNKYVILPNNFIKFTNSKIPQAIKHKKKQIYAILFHPEVRNKELIINFLNL